MRINTAIEEVQTMLTREELRKRINILLDRAPTHWIEMVYGFLLGLNK